MIGCSFAPRKPKKGDGNSKAHEYATNRLLSRYFQLQLTLNESLDLPLFLHCRNAAADLLSLLAPYSFKGVVHSFDGTVEEARKFIDMGYFIGLNGW